MITIFFVGVVASGYVEGLFRDYRALAADCYMETVEVGESRVFLRMVEE